MSLDDWQDNGDGTWTVKSEGATLWDVWGDNWDILSGVSDEEAARNIKVGYTFGYQNDKAIDSSLSSPLVSDLKTKEIENHIEVPDSMLKAYSDGQNILIGTGEFALGLIIIGAGVYAAYKNGQSEKSEDTTVGYDSILVGSAFLGFGLTRIVGANKEDIGYDLSNIFIPPMATFAEINPEDVRVKQ